MSYVNFGISSSLAHLAGSYSKRLSASATRLSTGYKYVNSGDDPGSFSQSVRLGNDIKMRKHLMSKLENTASYLSTQDGGLKRIGEIFDRMGQLRVMYSDQTKTSNDIDHYNLEFKELQTQLRYLRETEYNGHKLFVPSSSEEILFETDVDPEPMKVDGTIQNGGDIEVDRYGIFKSLVSETVGVSASSNGGWEEQYMDFGGISEYTVDGNHDGVKITWDRNAYSVPDHFQILKNGEVFQEETLGTFGQTKYLNPVSPSVSGVVNGSGQVDFSGADLSEIGQNYASAPAVSILSTLGNDTAQVDAINLTGGGGINISQVDTITLNNGGGSDTFNVTIDGNSLGSAVSFDTNLVTTAENLAIAINADSTLSSIVTATTSGAEITLTAINAGTAFVASSTATNNGGGAATSDSTITANSTADTFNVTIDGNSLGSAVSYDTDLVTTAENLAIAINADSTLSSIVTATTTGAEVTLTAVNSGTAFVASSTAINNGGGASSTDATNVPHVIGVDATASATVDANYKLDVSITNTGSNYSPGDTVTMSFSGGSERPITPDADGLSGGGQVFEQTYSESEISSGSKLEFLINPGGQTTTGTGWQAGLSISIFRNSYDSRYDLSDFSVSAFKGLTEAVSTARANNSASLEAIKTRIASLSDAKFTGEVSLSRIADTDFSKEASSLAKAKLLIGMVASALTHAYVNERALLKLMSGS